MLVLATGSLDATVNLAVEEYVFEQLPQGETAFWLWQNENAVIVGSHQYAYDEVDAAAVRVMGAQVVRRMSGGGAVYHDLGNLNFTLIAGGDGGIKPDFVLFTQPVVDVLQGLGVPATLSGRNDLVVEGMKFSGNAQYQRGRRVLHHGTLLFDADLGKIARLLTPAREKVAVHGVPSVRSRVTNLRPYLPQGFTADALAQALYEGIAPRSRTFALDGAAWEAIEAIRQRRYANDSWNWGKVLPGGKKCTQRFGGGTLTVMLGTEAGRIEWIALRGDFFGGLPIEGLERLLVGVERQAGALSAALSGIQVEAYVAGVTAAELVQMVMGCGEA